SADGEGDVPIPAVGPPHGDTAGDARRVGLGVPLGGVLPRGLRVRPDGAHAVEGADRLEAVADTDVDGLVDEPAALTDGLLRGPRGPWGCGAELGEIVRPGDERPRADDGVVEGGRVERRGVGEVLLVLEGEEGGLGVRWVE